MYVNLSDAFRMAAQGQRPIAFRKLNAHLMNTDRLLIKYSGARRKPILEARQKYLLARKLL